jgi:hypothetical protein
MKLSVTAKSLFTIACQLIITCCVNPAIAQKLQYSRENVFVGSPNHLQLVANIGGNHHLLILNDNENPDLFIFNSALELEKKVRLDFKFPERSVVSVIPFDNFYYLYIRPVLSQKHLLWKIDSDGNCTDYVPFFQKLLVSQAHNIKLGFQLIPYQNHLWMVYHTDLENNEKNTVVMAQTDSLLNVLFTNRVIYDFKRDEEKLQKEVLIFGKYLLALKTGRSSTTLELMKINLATGLFITNIFSSSGYFYSQSALSINCEDSSVTVSALLTEPRATANPKQFVFVSRLNKNLFEEVPFKILKSQFKKNTGTDFLHVNGQSEWMRFRIRGEQRNNAVLNNNESLYQDLTMTDNNADAINDISRMLQKAELSGVPVEPWNAFQGVRFSLLDKGLEITSDSLVANTKDYYTIKADQFIHFAVNNKEYMLLGQQFVKKNKGLLMVNTNDQQQLIYTDLSVNGRNNYLLTKYQLIPQKGIIVPYVHKLEAGLIKITVE